MRQFPTPRLAFSICLLLVPAKLFTQTPTLAQEQSDMLRSEAFELKGDVTAGDYRLAMVRAAEMAAIASGSPHAGQIRGKVERMSKNPSFDGPGHYLIPTTATAPVLPLVDSVLTAIEQNEADGVVKAVRTLELAIGDVAKEDLKQQQATLNPDWDADTEHFFTLWKALYTALATDDPAAASLAKEFQVLLERWHSQDKWIGTYTQFLYAINDALGRDAFNHGDYATALRYLHDQTEILLDKWGIFGPNLWLAQSLLSAGYHDEVLTFLEGLGPYWTKDGGRLDSFITPLHTKRTTSLAPNSILSYGYKVWP
jgi:hypothetical protein